MKVCVITDNIYIFDNFTALLKRKPRENARFDFYYTPSNKAFCEKFSGSEAIRPLRLKEQNADFFSSYDLFISLHCKQMFPKELVESRTCINVHPGYNPYNRGWFPQVFGIINKMPIGATIHLMDNEMDHGAILYQKKLRLYSYETSKDIYQRILAAEMELVEEHIDDILSGSYNASPMPEEGNLNLKKDFDALCRLDLNEKASYGEVIDRLRALTFSPYENAYFYDGEGNKVFVGITLKKEEEN